MKNLIIVSIVIISLFLQGCPGESFDEKPDGFIKLKNVSSGDIFIQQDTSEKNLSNFIFEEVPTIIVNINSESIYDFKNINFNSNRKYRLFVFKKSTLETHTWQEIKDQGLYDKRYSFTLDELKAINYQIIYDGN